MVDSNPGTHPARVTIDGGRYLYYSSAQNGVYDQIFVLDGDNNVLAIAIDYDYNFYVEPSNFLVTEKHIIGTENYKGNDFTGLIQDDRIYLKDKDTYDGIFLDFTFSDSLYDIWKISYTSSTSKLMEEVKAITSSQFIQSVQDRIVGDIIWQVTAQMIAYTVSVGIHAAIPIRYLNTILGTVGYLITYGLLSAYYATEQIKQNAQVMASHTFHNEDFEGEKTLSSKDAYSDLWGGTLPNVVGFSQAGVYTDIQLESDKFLFKGDILLAPQGIYKTKFLGFENIPISLDYEMQRGSYIIYSDFSDERLGSYLDSSSETFYMVNTLLYLENSLSIQTNGQYDTIFPYIIYGDGTFTPTFQVTGLNAKYPVPEFYHEYPIFVDKDYYSQLDEEDEYNTIYKVFDSNSTKFIQLIPDDATSLIYSDIDHIDIRLRNSLGVDIPFDPYSASDGHYSYDNETGILTLSDDKYNFLQGILSSSRTYHQAVEDYDVYYLFEIKLEKYRSTADLHGLAQEEVNHIATMQGIEQSLLEYTYQFKHAQNTQYGLSEMFYTFYLTTISTVITTVLTLGTGALANKFSTGVQRGVRLSRKALKALSYSKRLITRLSSSVSIPAAALSIVLSPLKESFQEIFIDPILETIVTNLVAKAGGDMFLQMLVSGLVEGGREATMGSMTQFLVGRTQANTQNSIEFRHVSQELMSDQRATQETIDQRESHIQVKPQWGSIIKTGASLILGAALIGIGGPMFFGASFACGFSAFQSISKGFKRQKIFIQQRVDSETAGIIDDLISDLDMIGISDEMQSIVEDEGISSFEEDSIEFTPEMLENTHAMRQYNREVESALRLLAVSARGGTWLKDPNLNFERAQEKARQEIKNNIDENIDEFLEKFEEDFGEFDLREDLDVAVDLMKEKMDYYTKHSMFVLKDENSINALLDQEHHGVIYIVWRILDQNGNPLAEPQPYVGQTIRTAKKRTDDERSKARRIKISFENNDGKYTLGDDDRYYRAMISYDESIVKLDDAFVVQLWDVAYSQLELDIKEAFWTDQFDSDNPEVGLNYFRGPPRWGYSREGGTFITKSDLVQGILEGLKYKGFERDQRYHGLKTSTIRTYISKYIRDDQGNVVKGLAEARIVLIKPFLLEAITAGLDKEGIENHLQAHGVTIIDQNYASFSAGLKYFLDKAFNGWDFEKCREEFFIKPEMARLLAQGYFIPGIGTEEILPSDFSDLLNRIVRRTLTLGTPTTGLGLIERLMLNGVRRNELTKVLGLWKDGDDAATRLIARSRMRRYFTHRWNLNSENEVLAFITTRYLLRDD